MNAVKIPSTNAAASLRFSDFDGSHFTVTLTSPALSAAVVVYAVPDLGTKDIEALVSLFKAMSENWKGWEGALSWSSLEGELSILATSDRLGHVNLRLKFREYEGPIPWSAEADFALEPMQVEQAYKQLVLFFYQS